MVWFPIKKSWIISVWLLLLTICCVFFLNNCSHYDWFSFSHVSFIFLKIFSIHIRDVCAISCHFVSNLSLLLFVSRRMKMMLLAIFPFPLSKKRHQPDGKNQLLQILTFTSVMKIGNTLRSHDPIKKWRPGLIGNLSNGDGDLEKNTWLKWISQLSCFVQCAYWSQNLFRRNM